MMDKRELPFTVGQLVEIKSFVTGYRGAWFRCKIKDIALRHKRVEYALQYYDFSDEKVRWTKPYQKKSRYSESYLMVRPSFPPVYRESQLLDIDITPMVVATVDVWRVGDLVDWWSDGCYWSGRLTEVLGNEKFRIELFPPPDGEGLSYEALGKDLRPSLDWSPEHDWTVPMPKEDESCLSCARLIKPLNQGCSANLTDHAVDDRRKEYHAESGTSFEYNASFSSHTSVSSLPPLDRPEQMAKRPLSPTSLNETQTPEINMDLDITDSGIGRTSCSDSVSSSHVRDKSTGEAGNAGGEDSCHNNGPSKKMRTDGSISLSSMCTDMVEAAILDLEELLTRVKWIKGILKSGMPVSNAVKPSWKFVEHRAPSIPK